MTIDDALSTVVERVEGHVVQPPMRHHHDVLGSAERVNETPPQRVVEAAQVCVRGLREDAGKAFRVVGP